MAFKRNLLLATTMIAGLAVMTPSLAAAQEQPQDQKKKEQPAASTTEVDAVVVTGSRIRRNEFTSSAPIQVITAEQSSLEGLVSTAEVLQKSTLAAGGFQTNNQLTGFVTTGGPGVQTVSLRGLGANRTLVLVDGHRWGPAGVRGQVGPFDLNVIPQAMIEREEILKDGASSIYGSDAVAGVINFISRKNLNGGVVNVFVNPSEKGGGNQYETDAAWGKTFDNGHFMVGATYRQQDVLRRGDRDDTKCAADYLFDPTTHERVDFKDTKGGAKCYNLLSNVLRTSLYGDLIYPDAGVTYPDAAHGNSGGTPANASSSQLSSGINPTPFGFVRQARAGFPDTYPYSHQDDPSFARASMVNPAKLYSVAASGGYNLTPYVEAYGEILLNRRESQQFGVKQLFPTVSGSNPNVPAGWGATLGSLQPIIAMKHNDQAQTVDYGHVLGGLRGTFKDVPFLDGWNWDIYAQASRSKAAYGGDFVYNDRVVAITGASACNPNPAGGNISGFSCSALPTGLPWLSSRVLAGNFNDAEQAFLFGYETGHTTYEDRQIEASITGDLFSLPAGKVGAAFGATWRYDKLDDTPGFNARNNNLWGSTSAGRTAGDDTVKELFAEVEIPLLKDIPLIEKFDVQLSGRSTHYDSYGSNSTYKIGLNWQVSPSVRFRATQGTSYRAPALYELYLANQSGFLSQTSIDPCIKWDESSNPRIQANCAAAGVPAGYTGANSSSATVYTGGGKGVLSAETSMAKTFGFVWTPKFMDLSIAVDYTEIEVDNGVSQFGAANILFACYNSPNYPNDPFCSNLFFTRDTTTNPAVPQITIVHNNYTNVATQMEHAIDLTTRYRHDFSFGRLTIDGQFTWNTLAKTQIFGNAVASDFNGMTNNFGGPDFVGKIATRFDRGDWTYSWTVDLIGKASDTERFGTDVGTTTRYSTTCTAQQSPRPAAPVTGPCQALIGSGGLTTVGVPVYFKQYTEATAYHTLAVRKKFDTWTVQAGVKNVFDERPPSASSGQFRQGTAALNMYDMVGRSYFMNLQKRF